MDDTSHGPAAPVRGWIRWVGIALGVLLLVWGVVSRLGEETAPRSVVPPERASAPRASGAAGETISGPAAGEGPRAVAAGPGARSELTVVLDLEERSFELVSLLLCSQPEGAFREERLTRDEERWELPAGRYLLRASGQGWRPLERTLELAPGAHVERVALQPASWLAGRVLDAVSGEPLPGFEVGLRFRGAPPERPIVQHSLRIADEAGAFRLAGLPLDVEVVALEFSAGGYLPSRTEWFPAGIRLEDLLVELVPESRGLARVRGSVQRPDGTAVPGAQLCLVRKETTLEQCGAVLDEPNVLPGLRFGPAAAAPAPYGAPQSMAAEPPEAPQRSSSSGAFELRARTGGEARILAYHPDHGLVLGEPLRLRPGEVIDVAPLVLPTTAEVVVHVAGARGRELTIEVASGRVRRSQTLVGDGSASFTGLPAGPASASAAVAVASPNRLLLQRLASATLEVPPQGRVEATLDLAPVRGTTLAGALRSPDERIDGWSLGMFVLADGTALGALVEEDGSFVFEGLLPGDYLLVAEGMPREEESVHALAVRRVRVEEGTSPPFLELAPRGRVTLRDGRAPLRRKDEQRVLFGSLALRPTDPVLASLLGAHPLAFRFDASGTCIWYGLPAGSVEVRHDGRSRTFEVSGAPEEQQEIELPG